MTGASACSARRSRRSHGTSRKPGHAAKTAGSCQTASGAGRPRGGERTTASGAGPDPQEVVAAVESLYYDGLQPFGRILRKRLLELSAARGEASTDAGSAALRAVCETGCGGRLVVEPSAEGTGDWSALLTDRPAAFVDIYSPVDVYPLDLWGALAGYLGSLSVEDGTLPGGRYACAQELIMRGLPFFGSYCFGQVCHIVQLAISQRKLLGYLDGAVVPYARSQSMLKEHCAAQNQNCPGKSVCPWPTATWDMVRACMREILSSSGCEDTVAAGPPGTMPLSNVKRLFRSRFHMELSETALGYSKLSELLTDTRLQDICTVQLHRQGYVVVPRAAHAEVVPIEPVAWYNADVGMPQCFAEACAATPHTPRQPQALCVNETFEVAQPSQTFCVGEPLEFDFEDNDACDGSLGCEAEPLCAITQMKPLKVPASALSPSVLAKDGRIGRCVRNTFIHAAPAPPTPLPKAFGTASRRSRSLPKDMYSVKDEWEGACNTLGFLPQPVESDASASEDEAEVGDDYPVEAARCLPATPAMCWPATPARCWPDTPECGVSVHAPQLHLALLVC